MAHRHGPDYENEGACRLARVDPDLFFPTREERGTPETDRALAWCRSCRISEECLQDNIGLSHGVVGGTTGKERSDIRLRRLAGAKR